MAIFAQYRDVTKITMYIILYNLIEKANINVKNSICFCVSRSKNFFEMASWKFLQSLFANVPEIFYLKGF